MVRRYNPVCLGVCLLVVTSCGTPLNDFTSDAPKEAHAQVARVTHDINFADDELRISRVGSRELDGFLAAIGVANEDQILLVDRDRGSPWSAQRIESVRTHLNQFQLPTQVIQNNEVFAERPNIVTVVVERYSVMPLSCADWTQPRGSNPENATHRDFGCADAVNLGAMVVNKRDLYIGRELGAANGELAARSINRYQRDVKKPLEVPDTSPVTSQAPPSSGSSP